MNYTDQVRKYIQTGTMSDLQAMSELAFEISMEMQDAYEERNEQINNQELLRIAKYKEYKTKKRKDGRMYTDTQADKLAKEYAMKKIDPNNADNKYRRYKLLYEALANRKIEVQTINKQKIDVLPNNR